MKFELVCVHDWDWSRGPAGIKMAFCKSLCHQELLEGQIEPRVVLAVMEEVKEPAPVAIGKPKCAHGFTEGCVCFTAQRP